LWQLRRVPRATTKQLLLHILLHLYSVIYLKSFLLLWKDMGKCMQKQRGREWPLKMLKAHVMWKWWNNRNANGCSLLCKMQVTQNWLWLICINLFWELLLVINANIHVICIHILIYLPIIHACNFFRKIISATKVVLI